ncbi:MAG: CPBP family intramembrane glutamic endopeptidase [Candidatus Paceibacterota bacterium]|jgi:membrane protease YdiL (CAAX protease family)
MIIKEILVFIFIFIISWFVFDKLGSFSNTVAQLSVGAIPLLFLAFYPIFITLKKKKNLSEIGFTFKNWLGAISWGISIALIIVILNQYLFSGEQLADFNNWSWGIIYWAFLAFSQEIFFRGYFQKNLEKIFGNFLGLIFTAFLFSLWHITIRFYPGWMTATSLLKVFLVGLLWGLSFQKTRSLIAPCLSHFLVGILLSSY